MPEVVNPTIEAGALVLTLAGSAIGAKRAAGGVVDTVVWWNPASGDLNVQAPTGTDAGGGTRRFVIAANSVDIGAVWQTSALVRVRVPGNAYEFGHTNGAGYGSTIGCETSTGSPFLAFSAEAGTTANTYRTRGLKPSIVRLNAVSGALEWGTLGSTNADNQAFVALMSFTSSGNLTLVAGGGIATGTLSAAGAVTFGSTLSVAGAVTFSNATTFANVVTAPLAISGTTGAGLLRVGVGVNAGFSTGAGLELSYDTAAGALAMYAYDRGSPQFRKINLDATVLAINGASAGPVTINGMVQLGGVNANSLSVGELALPNNKYIRASNAAGTTNAVLIGRDVDNKILIDANGFGTKIAGTLNALANATVSGTLSVGGAAAGTTYDVTWTAGGGAALQSFATKPVSINALGNTVNISAAGNLTTINGSLTVAQGSTFNALVTAAVGLQITGGGFNPGVLYKDANYGMVITGITGASDQFSIFDVTGGVQLVHVKTGESSVRFAGQIYPGALAVFSPGTIGTYAAYGMVVQCKTGVQYDFTLMNVAATAGVIMNPTGTADVLFGGKLIAPSLPSSPSGLAAGSLYRSTAAANANVLVV